MKDMTDYAGKLVRKPWGFERQLIDNGTVAVWHLRIEAGQSTSMHLHKRKRTALVVLGGVATVRFMSGGLCAEPLDKVQFYPMQYHQTSANGQPLDLLEVETPSDKDDLVRLEDQYGRAGKGYEGPEAWDDDPEPVHLQNSHWTNVGGCALTITRARCVGEFDNLRPSEQVIFLQGGIRRGHMTVSSPGAVMSAKQLRRLAEKYELLPSEVLEVSRA